MAKLNNKAQFSCGCLIRTREYGSWKEAKSRVSNPRHISFYRYGGRGITMCDEWKGSFFCFLKDMGYCPKGYTLDRVNNNGDYEKNNCRWATHKQQSQNTSTTKLTLLIVEKIKILSETLNQKQIAKDLSIHQTTVSRVLTGKRW